MVQKIIDLNFNNKRFKGKIIELVNIIIQYDDIDEVNKLFRFFESNRDIHFYVLNKINIKRDVVNHRNIAGIIRSHNFNIDLNRLKLRVVNIAMYISTFLTPKYGFVFKIINKNYNNSNNFMYKEFVVVNPYKDLFLPSDTPKYKFLMNVNNIWKIYHD